MKKIFFSLIIVFLISTKVLAGHGESNMSSGGGSLGCGTKHSYWIPGNEGVRITLINTRTCKTESRPFDLTNVSPNVDFHFGYRCKVDYTSGQCLNIDTSPYYYYNPTISLPQIISDLGSNSRADLGRIKAYFCDEQVVQYISSLMNIAFENLVSGKYKLLIEPIVYIKFLGEDYAMTATEAALLNKQTSGQLYAWMRSLTHKNLPLSMFLENDSLGFPAYHGDTDSLKSDNCIFDSLGLGIVSFINDVTNINRRNVSYTYEKGVEVITPVYIFSNEEISPDDPVNITFSINGRNYHTQTIVPEKQYQLAWVKWRTPDTEQNFTINVSADKGILCQENIPVSVISSSKENSLPPDPKATDRPSSIVNHVIQNTYNNEVFWDVWVPIKHNDRRWRSNWDWDEEWHDSGNWNDQTWYEYRKVRYTASLSAKLKIFADDSIPHRSEKTLKSGYGIQCRLETYVKTNAPSSAIVAPQKAWMSFPEFYNRKYYSPLERMSNNNLTSVFMFEPNRFSPYKKRVHYTPLWYPDKDYTTWVDVSNCWTPGGMLYSNNLMDSVHVSGNLYSDWHNAIG